MGAIGYLLATGYIALAWLLMVRPVVRLLKMAHAQPPRSPEPIHVIQWHPGEHLEAVALRAVGYAECMNRVVRIERTNVHVFPQSVIDDVVTAISDDERVVG